MARQIVITIPEDGALDEYADFVAYVAQQIDAGLTSGHFTPDRRWEVLTTDWPVC
jgi:hypothetical protein